MNLSEISQAIRPELTEVERRLKDSLSAHVPNVAAHDGLTSGSRSSSPREGSFGNEFTRKLTRHINRVKGKRLRPTLLILSARASGRVKPIHFNLAVIIELIHNATLIHDDVLDEARLRRHLPSLNARWDNETSILFGDYLFSGAFLSCACLPAGRLGSQQAIKIISATTRSMCWGELTHTGEKYNLDLTEKEYLNIIRHKTASLFGTASRLGALFATTPASPRRSRGRAHLRIISALTDYGVNFGMAYQIMDDYLDIVSTEKSTGKTTGSDLSKGKITLPIIQLVRRLPVHRRNYLKNLIISNGFPAQRKKITRLLNQHDSFAYTLGKVKYYVNKAKDSLRPLPASPDKESLNTMVELISVERRA